jgi:hypothetical protein
MISLKVNNQSLILPESAKISIEKNSPVFNKDTGAFSYPFAVPTEKNQKILAFPGRLERANDLPDQTFILAEDGIQILSGTVDYDDVTAPETGLILQSGTTEFTKKMDGKKLSEINFGRETWFNDFDNITPIINKLNEWNARNSELNVIDYVVCPFAINGTDDNILVVNKHDYSTEIAELKVFFSSPVAYNNVYCLQFSVNWVLVKLYEAAGFRIIKNELIDSEFKNVVVFGKLFRIYQEYVSWEWQNPQPGAPAGFINIIGYVGDYIYYKDLMPDQDVLDFIEAIKSALCITIDIDERLKTVSFIFNKNILNAENIDNSHNLKELKGFAHKEKKSLNGIKLFYTDQDDDYTSETDFTASLGEFDNETSKPVAKEDYYKKIIKITSVNRYYICDKNDLDEYVWKRYARLQAYKTGNGEDETEIKIKVPPQLVKDINFTGDADMPFINFTLSTFENFTDINQLAILLFRGRRPPTFISHPVLSAEQYSPDGSIDYNSSLMPSYIYVALFKEWVNSKAYKKREVTKYLLLSLAEVVSLQFRKRYLISGVSILLNKVNFDLPYRGIVKINGFTT